MMPLEIYLWDKEERKAMGQWPTVIQEMLPIWWWNRDYSIWYMPIAHVGIPNFYVNKNEVEKGTGSLP